MLVTCEVLTKPLKLDSPIGLFNLGNRKICCLNLLLGVWDQALPLITFALSVHHAQQALLREVEKLRLVQENRGILIYCIVTRSALKFTHLVQALVLSWILELILWRFVYLNHGLLKIHEKLGWVDIWFLAHQSLVIKKVGVKFVYVVSRLLDSLFELLDL